MEAESTRLTNLSSAQSCHHLDARVGTDGRTDVARHLSQSGDHHHPITPSLTLDIAAAASTSGFNDSTACLFRVPESPATTCKHSGGASTRGRKTSLTGISTGSNGSNSSSGVSSMTSEQFDAAIAASSLGGKGDATSCSTLDLVSQRRNNGSSSSFSVEEEDANDVYSR